MSEKHVYTAIAQVMREMARTGISKDRHNDQQGFKFRGIDDVLNALARVLADAKLCVLPRVVSRHVTERTNAKGTALFYVVLEVEFDLVSAVDGSTHTVRTMGEAMDSGDKATNKAMSAAYKYMAIQTFAIPTEGDNDADATTHEVASQSVVPANPERDRALRRLADDCIALHAKAETMFEADGDTRGFWALWEYCKKGLHEEEEKERLWVLLKEHSAVRAALKEYAAYDRTGTDRKPKVAA